MDKMKHIFVDSWAWLAWMLRKKLHDKPFISFTDLTSFILMKELSIKKVFTGDTDFEKVNMGFQLLK